MKKKRTIHISVFGSRATSIVSVTLVLVLLGLVALITASAHRLTDNVRRNLGFTIKMERAIEATKINAVKQAVISAPYTESFVYSGPDEILAQESEIIGEDIMLLVDENPYGAEIDVRLRPQWACSDSIDAISTHLSSIDGVEEILTDTGAIDSVNRNIARVTWIMLAVALALLVISFVLINNTVSLSVYSRRFVIHTMRLVGATGAFIRKPFLSAGAMTGLVAGTIASLMLACIQAYVVRIDPALAANMDWTVSVFIYLIVIATGVTICLLASAFATNRYLRSDIDDYYSK